MKNTIVHRLGRLTKYWNTLKIYSLEPIFNFQEMQSCPKYMCTKCSLTRRMDFRKYSTSPKYHRIYTSPIPSLNIKEESLADYFFPKFEKFGNRQALVDNATGKTYTYLEMKDAITKVGSALYKLGYRKGDVVCACSTNNSEYAILILACVTSGIILTATSPAFTLGEVIRCLGDSGASGIVVLDTFLPKVKEAVESEIELCNSIKNIIVIGSSDGYRSFASLLEDDGKCFPDDISFDPKNDVALLPYSSGTTGFPKGVMLTHMNLVSNLQQTRSLFTLTPDDVCLVFLPLFHGSILMGILQDGGKAVIIPRFEPTSFLNTIVQHRVTKFFLVPPVALFLAKHPLVANYNLCSVETFVSGAAPLGEALSIEFQNRLKKPILQGYGLTELSPVTALDTLPPYNIGTVGVLVPNSSAKIICQESGRELGTAENGEVCIKGPHVMKGYHNNEEATKNIIKDGWLHTGDIGHVREDGRLVITERLKELIKYKGFQVAPAEVEDLLLKHKCIQDAAVIGVPDEEAGELPRAYIVPRPNMKVTPEDIVNFVKENAAPHKTLRGGVEFLTEIPKSPSGKILRRHLRNML